MSDDFVTDESTKKAVFLVATIAAFMTPFMASSINVALPAIEANFQIDTILLSWIPTSYLLSTCMFLAPFGRLADIVGRKNVFVCGSIIFSIAACLSAVSYNIWMLLTFRVLQGMGSAMIFGTGMAMLATVFPPGERGRAIGINVAAVYIGMAVGPFIGGILTEHFSWRGVFASTVPLGVLCTCVSLWKLRWKRKKTEAEKFDVMGSILYGIAIRGVMLGLSKLPSVIGALSIVGGIGFFILFVKCELKTQYPVISMDMFLNNRPFAFSGLAALINYSATFAVSFLLSLYLQYVKGFSPKEAGLVLMVQPIAMAILSPLAGRASDRIEPQRVASLGMLITAIGLFLMSFLNANTETSMITANLAVLGLGFALFSSPNMNAIMSSVDRSSYGLASGVVSSMRLMGQMLSMGLVSVMFALYIGPVDFSPKIMAQFLECLNRSFIIFAIICVIGIYFSLARGRILGSP